MINIMSNGSKWMGENPDTIEKLCEVLKNYPLDRTFEDYGNFIITDGVTTTFFGNFLNLSHVFNIITDEIEIIELLTGLILENRKRTDYLSQDLGHLKNKFNPVLSLQK
jgi:hypothetical protein